MKYLYILVVLVLITQNIDAQKPAIQWEKRYGSITGLPNEEDARSVLQTFDGGFVFAGTVSGNDGDALGLHISPVTNFEFPDFWVVKLDKDGIIEWQKCLGGSSMDKGSHIIQTKDSGFIVVGYTLSFDGDVSSSSVQTGWVVKLNKKGNIVWQKLYGGTTIDFITKIVDNLDNTYTFCGTARSKDYDANDNHGERDFWVVKIDSVGNVLWHKCYGGSRNEVASDIKRTNDGGYIVLGTATSLDYDVIGYHDNCQYLLQTLVCLPDVWIVKIDSIGNIQWKKLIGGFSVDKGNSILQCKDGSYIFTGCTSSINGDVNIPLYGPQDVWFVKLDVLGNIMWQKSYGTINGYNEGITIEKTLDNGFIVAAKNEYPNPMGIPTNYSCPHSLYTDYWIIKLDSLCNMVWHQVYGGSGNDIITCIQQTKDTGYIVCGKSGYEKDGDIDSTKQYGSCWIVKLGKGFFTPTVNIRTAFDTVCINSNVVFTATANYGGPKPTYQWKKNGVNIGTNSNTLVITNLVDNDTIYCQLKSSLCVPLTTQNAVSNKIIVRVKNILQPLLNMTVNMNPICKGASAIFTSTTTNAGINPQFEWKVNNQTIAGINNNTFSTTTLKNNDTIICSLNSNNTSCYSQASDTVIIKVDSILTPTIIIKASDTSICLGKSIVFNSSLVNGGNNPSYDWFINGININNNKDSFQSSSLTNNDTISCSVNSSLYCLTNSFALSNKIGVAVTSPILINISPLNYNVCQGSNVQLNASASNAIASTQYQWQKNNQNIGSNSTLLSINNISINDSGSYVLKATNGICGGAISNTAKIEVRDNTSSLTIDTVCSGKSYLFNGNLFYSSGLYTTNLLNNVGCDSAASLDLTVIPNTVSVQKNLEVFAISNESILLSPQVKGTNLTYLWQPKTYLNTSIINPAVCKPTSNIVYHLFVSDGICMDTGTISVKVFSKIEIPTAFSPNNDATNDTWAIKNLNSFVGVSVNVFDRYGRMVFTSFGYNHPWNGTYMNNGNQLPIGVYYYTIEVKGELPQKFSGSVMILK